MLLLLRALSRLATSAEAQSTPTEAREYIRVVQEEGHGGFKMALAVSGAGRAILCTPTGYDRPCTNVLPCLMIGAG
jgi:hypothetical protein